ncbi:hypothetical protein GCM10009563_14460 [Subtercola frigoramans]
MNVWPTSDTKALLTPLPLGETGSDEAYAALVTPVTLTVRATAASRSVPALALAGNFITVPLVGGCPQGDTRLHSRNPQSSFVPSYKMLTGGWPSNEGSLRNYTFS